MINFDKTYKKGFAPVTLDEDKNIVKTKIEVSVNLLTILKIDEVESTFSCQLNLLLSWFDQRLNFNNLKDDPNYNTLSDDERNNIWTPKIIFANTEKRDALKRDGRAFATVVSNGQFVMASDDILDNAFIYKGTENPINLSRGYKGMYANRFKEFLLCLLF